MTHPRIKRHTGQFKRKYVCAFWWQKQAQLFASMGHTNREEEEEEVKNQTYSFSKKIGQSPLISQWLENL